MFDFSGVNIEKIIVHRVGSAAVESSFKLSDNELAIEDEDLKKLLSSFFLTSFKNQSFYSFSHDADLSLNEAYVYAGTLFTEPERFVEGSVNFANHLRSCSGHPNIKTGEFYVVLFSNCVVDDEVCNAVGLFKSENKDSFIKVYDKPRSVELGHDTGISINKLDKGCLIFETEAQLGYKICITDRTNKHEEARYWMEDFLNVKPREDSFYHTRNLLDVCRHFSEDILEKDYGVEKKDRLLFIDKSLNFLKEHDKIELPEFEQAVLEVPEVIEAFRSFKTEFEAVNQIRSFPEFETDAQAIKKSQKFMRSVIKLDKNFHLYVHGRHDLIESGYDEEKGMKYYKVFYLSES